MSLLNVKLYNFFLVCYVYLGCALPYLAVSAIAYPAPNSISPIMERRIYVWDIAGAYGCIAASPSPISVTFSFALDIGDVLLYIYDLDAAAYIALPLASLL